MITLKALALELRDADCVSFRIWEDGFGLFEEISTVGRSRSGLRFGMLLLKHFAKVLN